MTDGHGYFLYDRACVTNRKKALTAEKRDVAITRVKRQDRLGN